MEKRKISDDLDTANNELAFQNEEKEKRAAELAIANKELVFQNREKEKLADELIMANKELAFQNKEKEKRAAELIIANKELAFQNEEKEKRAAELVIANKELVFQNREKVKRAAELNIANKELVFQNREKEKRADELIMANKELAFQNKEKSKRAAELTVANQKLAIQYESSQHWAAIVESSEDAIISKSLDGTIKSWNNAAEKMFGYTAQQAIGKNISLIIPPEYINYEKIILEKILNNERIEHSETVRMRKNGEHFYVSLSISPIKDKEGKITSVSKIVRDITAHKNAEKEIKNLNETLEQKVIDRTAQLEEVNKELEAFSYSASHDLRAPLRHIGGYVDMLIKNNAPQLDDTGRRYLNTISEASHEMGNLIDALLSFSRLSRTELQHSKINSKNMVNLVLKGFSDELADRNVEIKVSELTDIMGDHDLITQVWVNLISNAIKYTQKVEKAVIEIGSYPEDDNTIFYVKDNGAGFDMKYSGKLFGVFQRLHKAKDFEGIGIGLANVNRIVTRHGGKCRAESEVDKGATFFFSIPKK